jgi:tRNA(Ile)-lysidine synthase
MEELNPSIKDKVLGLLDDFTALNRSLERGAEGFLEQHCEEGNGRVVLPVMPLRLLDEEVRFRVITGALFRIAKLFIPLREHIRLIDHILHSTKPNLVVDLPGMIRARRTYQSLVFSRKTPVVPVMETSPIRNGCNRCIPLGICLEVTSADVAGDISETFSSIKTESGRETAFFDKDMVGDLYARTFRKGDRFSPLGMEHSVKLKDFFISMKIPKEDRAGIPLLLSGDSVIWIIGYRIDHRYRVTDRTKSILKVTVRKIEECRHAGQGA